MKHLLSLVMFFAVLGHAEACCGANQHKLFLLGSSDEKLVVAEMKLFRFCNRGEGAGPNNEFHWRGVVNVGYYQGDSVNLIQNLDTIRFLDCKCTYRVVDSLSHYLDSLQPYLDQAYKVADKLPSFKEAVPMEYQYNGRSDTLDYISFVDDSTLGVNGKVIPLTEPYWGACGYLAHINDIRTYQLGSKYYTLLNISCGSSRISLARQEQNPKLFRNKQVTYDGVEWHGNQKGIILRGNLMENR